MDLVRRGGAAALALGLALLLAAGCGEAQGSEDEPVETPGRGGPSYVERLGLLPRSLADGGGSMQVHMADLDWVAALSGAERPDDPTDETAVRDYLSALHSVKPDSPSPGAGAGPPNLAGIETASFAAKFDADFGWSAVDVDWYAEVLARPAAMAVLGGAFDQDRLTGAMGAPSDGIWTPDKTVIDSSIVWPPHEPGWLALDRGRLFAGTTVEMVEEALAGGGTLAEVPELAALAAAMDTEQVYTAGFHVGGSYQTPAPLPTHIDEPIWLEPFRGLAVGRGYGAKPYTVLAYTHADTGLAEANAKALRALIEDGVSFYGRHWSELLTVDEIRVDGTTVIARLDPTRSGVLSALLTQPETLSVHR